MINKMKNRNRIRNIYTYLVIHVIGKTTLQNAKKNSEFLSYLDSGCEENVDICPDSSHNCYLSEQSSIATAEDCDDLCLA